MHIDPAPLRNAAFLYLWWSRTVTALGSSMTSTALLLHIARVTQSPAMTGASLAIQLPLVVSIGLIGGVWVDQRDRREVILVTETGLLLTALGLVGLAMMHRPLVVILFGVVVLGAALTTLQQIALDAAIQQVVDAAQMSAAAGWMSLSATGSGIVGPALGAAIFWRYGPATVYGLDVATFVASLALLVGVPSLIPPVGSRQERGGRRDSFREGFAYLRGRPDLVATYALDLTAMALASPLSLLAFLPASRSSGGASLVFAAPPLGAFVMSLASGWTSTVRRPGRATGIVCGLYAASSLALGAIASPAASIAALALGGALDCLSGIFRATLWSTTVPSHMRGRIAGYEVISYAAGVGT